MFVKLVTGRRMTLPIRFLTSRLLCLTGVICAALPTFAIAGGGAAVQRCASGAPHTRWRRNGASVC